MSAALSIPPATILDLPDGLHAGIPEALYHARIPGVASKSVLDMYDRAPAVHDAWLKGAEGKTSEAFAFGKAFHCAVLEPDVYRATYTVEPDFTFAEPDFGDCRFKEAKAKRDAWREANGYKESLSARDRWREANAGKQLLEQADATAIAGMVRSIAAHPLASKMLLGDGVSELTVKWTDPATGIVCKSRADRYAKAFRLCVDLKSTDDARASVFAKSVANHGYHRQAAFYEDGFAAVGEPLDGFVFVAVEKRPPYLVAIFNLEDEDVMDGRRENRAHLSMMAECIERGVYPGYPETIQTLSLPRWAKGTNR